MKYLYYSIFVLPVLKNITNDCIVKFDYTLIPNCPRYEKKLPTTLFIAYLIGFFQPSLFRKTTSLPAI